MTYEEAVEAANLTPLQRKYLDLYLNGHPIRTIARAHNTSPTNIRDHLETALRKIRAAQEDAA